MDDLDGISLGTVGPALMLALEPIIHASISKYSIVCLTN